MTTFFKHFGILKAEERHLRYIRALQQSTLDEQERTLLNDKFMALKTSEGRTFWERQNAKIVAKKPAWKTAGNLIKGSEPFATTIISENAMEQGLQSASSHFPESVAQPKANGIYRVLSARIFTMASETTNEWLSIRLKESCLLASGGLPSTMSSTAINVNYQVTASIQLVSFIPFSQQYQVTKPFVLVHRDVAPEDTFLRSGVLHLTSKSSNRLIGRISSPSVVLPQSGTIPMMIHLNLQGKSTSVSKVVIELWESVFHQCPVDQNQGSTEGFKEVHLEERLVTRQNCPIVDWPTSTAEGEPAVIAKRLLFKVPEAPLKPWSEEVEEITIHDRRSSTPRGFCHSSKAFPDIRTRVEHTLRAVVYIGGLREDAVESDSIEEDVAEQEIKVIVVGLHLEESVVDETLPPSYNRSFTNVLVEGARLAEIDRNSIEALRDSNLGEQSLFPPCYEESISSTPSSPRTRVALESDIRDILDICSHQGSGGESSSSSSTYGRSSADTYAYDLAAYNERIQ
ncbi:hypothetical protein BGX20_009030 [Mortierella sp. AD010]|nr:hypothetical protein BGX20_009030 [Mortierella sp. AD010]